MAVRDSSARRAHRLDPVRWTAPGRATVLRGAVGLVLLATAAAVLSAGHPGTTPTAGGPQLGDRPAGSASPADGASSTVERNPAAHGGSRSGEPASGPGSTGPAAGSNGGAGDAAGGMGDAAGGAGDGPAGGDPPGPPGRSCAGGPTGAGGPPAARPGAPADPVRGGPACGWLPVPRGLVGVSVRLAESSTLAVVRPGDRVDLLAVPAGGGAGRVVATRALVLGVVGDPTEPTAGTAALYLALSPAQARRTVASPDGARFAALVHP